MKKIYSFMVAAVAVFGAVACTQELDNNVPEANGETVVFTAYADGADETKTVLNTTGEKPVSEWESGNRIWILNGKEGNTGWKKAYATTDAGSKAVFTPEDSSYPLEGDQYFAVYPADAANDATWEGGDVMGVTLNPKQIATGGSYDPAAHVAVAKSETTSLSFKNAVSLFKFTVKNEGVKSVTIYANGDGLLTGSCNISAEGNVTPWTGEGEANGWVELSAGEGSFEVGEEYYIAVFPNTDEANLTEGFTVEFSFDGITKLAVKSYTKALTLNRNQILDLGDLEYVEPVVETTTFFMRPSSGWIQENGRYVAWCWGEDVGVWCDFVDSDSDGIYEVNIPVTCENAIFLCMSKDTNNDWANELARTADLTLPTDDKNCYNVYTSEWTTVADAKAYDPGAIYAEEGYVYLKPNSNWTQANAWFAIYLCNGSKEAEWLKMSKVEGTLYYGVKLPSDFSTTNYKNIIFCRMDPASTVMDWPNKWNQSGDLACNQITGGKNCCAINSGQWDCGTNVTWSTVTKLN